MTPKQYLDKIEKLYFECKKANMSRFSVEWGKPSAKANRYLQLQLKSDGVDEKIKTQWKYAFAYWTIKSKLLELHHRSKLFGGTKKKRLAREATKVKKLALNPNSDPFNDDDYPELVRKALNI